MLGKLNYKPYPSVTDYIYEKVNKDLINNLFRDSRNNVIYYISISRARNIFYIGDIGTYQPSSSFSFYLNAVHLQDFSHTFESISEDNYECIFDMLSKIECSPKATYNMDLLKERALLSLGSILKLHIKEVVVGISKYTKLPKITSIELFKAYEELLNVVPLHLKYAFPVSNATLDLLFKASLQEEFGCSTS